MKKLNLTILFLFSSMVLFGQAIEYRDFEFSQNGESLSMSAVERMTDSLNTGQYRFYLARKQLFVSQSSKTTFVRNLTNVLSASIYGGYGIGGISIDLLFNDQLTFIGVGGVVLVGVGLNSLRFVGTKARYASRADKNFQRVARNLNSKLLTGY